MKENITIQRIGYSDVIFEVEGDTREEREAKALEMANDHTFNNEYNSEIFVENSENSENSSKIQVLILVEGGVVQRVFCNDSDKVQIVIRDLDIEGIERDLAAKGLLYEGSNGDRYMEYTEDVFPIDALSTPPLNKSVTQEEVL